MKEQLVRAYNKIAKFTLAEKEPEPKLEGLGFRFKTVQYHLVDDFFEEIKKKKESFGDVKILSERFSLPGVGESNEYMSKDEYQFEIVVEIEDKVDKVTYYRELVKAANLIEEKHGLEVYIEPYEDYFNLNKVTFHTAKEGIFSKE
jgi:hypothetical protein